MLDKLSILKSLWRVFLLWSDSPDENCEHRQITYKGIDKWLDAKVVGKIKPSKLAMTINELAVLCEVEGVIDASFEQAIKTLNDDWLNFNAQAKSVVIKIVKKYKLEEIVKVNLQLTPLEQEELSIQWDGSDSLYFHKKQEVVKTCMIYGLNLEKCEINDGGYGLSLSHCTYEILSALRYKSELDIGVISIAAPNNLQRYIENVEVRTEREFVDFYIKLQDALTKFLSPLFIIDWDLNRFVDFILDKFKKDFEELKLTIPKMSRFISL